MQWKSDIIITPEELRAGIPADETLTNVLWTSHMSRAALAHKVAIYIVQSEQPYIVGIHYINGHSHAIRTAHTIVGSNRFGLYLASQSGSVYARSEKKEPLIVRFDRVVTRTEAANQRIPLL